MKIKFWLNYFILLTFYFLFSPHAVSAATSYDMADTGSFNIRIDGATNTEHLGEGSATTADIDNDGLPDLIIGATKTTYNGTNSGSVYVIYNSLFNTLAGTGNTIDLSDSSNYNLRFDGPSNSYLTYAGYLGAGDVDSDGKADLFMAGGAVSDLDSVYIIYNTRLDDYSGTGNNIDLTDADNYNLRFYAEDGIGMTNNGPLKVYDINGNNKQDLLIPAGWSSFNGRDTSGSVYLVYDSLIDDYSGTGNLIDLSDGNNYNFRFDGADEAGGLGLYPNPQAADIDNDNKLDLLMSATGTSTSVIGKVYVIYNSLLSNYSGTGHNLDLDTDTNWNLRFDGPAIPDVVGFQIISDDLDNDNKQDIIFSGIWATNNSLSKSGSVYVIYNSLIDGYSGTGHTFDLTDSSNFSLRFDGPIAAGWLGDIALTTGDLDTDDRQDLIFGGPHQNNSEGEIWAGVNFIYYHSTLNNYSGAGNIIDLATNPNYDLRYEGAAQDDRLAIWSYQPVDLNQDGSEDLIITAHQTDHNGSNSGSLFIIYNFPHSFSISREHFTNIRSNITDFSGTLSASNSVTNISNIQYSIDNTSWGGDWRNCNPKDGSFNSTSEEFGCADIDTSNLKEGKHTIYTRANDENISYTSLQNYGSFDFNLDRTNPKDFSLLTPL
jgi:hypothetical protein